MPEIVFGGMPAWLLETYLVELGGTPDGDGAVAGDGWRATLQARARDGIAIARVAVRIEGERADTVMVALRKKAQRGGG
jgi:hypothetical protein